MNFKVLIDCFDMSYWETCGSNFNDYNIYQTWPYQQIRAENTATKLSRFVVLGDDDVPVMMGQIRIKSLFSFKLGYIQMGPVFQNREKTIEDLHQAIINLQETLIEKLRLNVIRINLNLWDDQKELAVPFQKAGFEEAKYYKKNKTFIVPLEPTVEEILNKIDGGNRRLIRKAEKLGLEIEISHSEDYFAQLHKMYLEAKQRKGFTGVDSLEIWNTQKNLSIKEKIELIVLKYNNEVITIMATSHLGSTAIPVLTANSTKSLELQVSNYLFWLAYLSAKNKNMKYYDLCGYDEVKNPQGFLFKRRMGGIAKQFLPPLDYCTNYLVKMIWSVVSKKYYS
jgi:hypothetical protein